MLTPKQKKWINHLPDDDKIMIFSFDKTSQDVFEKIKEKIQTNLDMEIKVEHRGSTSLGIAGQNEIDVYIPVSGDIFYAKTLVSELFIIKCYNKYI